MQRFCVNRGLQANDAADVAQEVLLRVSKAIREFEYQRERGRFRDWLYRITRNELSRWLSRNPAQLGSLKEVESTREVAEWTQTLKSHLFTTALERVRKTVEPETWIVFEQTWLLGKSAPQVAEANQQSVEFVYHAKSRVLKKLKAEILRLADDAIWLD